MNTRTSPQGNTPPALGLPVGASANPDGETQTEIAQAPSWKILQAQNYRPGATGLPEGATAAEIPAKMQADWNNYFDQTRAGQMPLEVLPGAWMTRVSDQHAHYAHGEILLVGLSRNTNLNWLAHEDPDVAAAWNKAYGFTTVPLSS